jgi:N-acetyl-gamma-glutamyl-phosphate reductase
VISEHVRVAIIGATGYAGIELVRILSGHSKVVLAVATSQHHQGRKLSEIHPSLGPCGDITLETLDLDQIREAAEVVFVALPAGSTFAIIPELVKRGMRVIDLGPDFRLHDVQDYQKHYGPHGATEILSEAVYGLTEIHRKEIASARLVGNPGCYATAVVLALAPLMKERLVSGSVIVDAKSGVSGAGRGGGVDLSFCEVHESIKAYAVGKHRHVPEMESEFHKLSGSKMEVVFVPHLVPMNRGILTTSYLNLTRSINTEGMRSVYRDFYDGESFVTIKKLDEFPETREVRGSNVCAIGVHMDVSRKRAIVVSAIDNLVKGAAGQAVQNMNRMKGFREWEGLLGSALFP